MLDTNVNRKIILSILMILLLCGLQGMSHARVCQVGDVIAPGESCTYVADGKDIVFSVNEDGAACREGGPVVRGFLNIARLNFCRGDDIERDDTFNSIFAASRNPDSTWTIEAVPAETPVVAPDPEIVGQGPKVTGGVVSPLTEARNAFESSMPSGYTRVTLSNSGTVWGVPTKYTTDSEVDKVTYMLLAELKGCDFATAEQARQSKVYIKTQSLGRLNNYESETVCGISSNRWASSWNGVRITHIRYYDENSLPNVQEAVYDASTGQYELVTEPTSTPDFVVEAVGAEPATVAPGETFRLYATLKNSGTQESTATTLRYYRSTDAVISTADTQLGRAGREPLAANATIRRYLNVTAPTTPGTYYYGVCVDSVTDESNTDNNCSGAVSVTVTAEIPVTGNTNEALLAVYWIGWNTDKIQRANLDGSNVQDLVTGLESPRGIALDVLSSKMYWTDWGTDKIQRANLDGSNVQDLVTQGLDIPRGIVLDVSGGKMYWTDSGTDKIQRANLDGSNVEDLVTQGLDIPGSIALDVSGGKMYWTDEGTDKIQRANLDGSNVQDLVTQGLDYPWGIALDVSGGKMYWTDWGTDKIQRANLDGSNIEDLVTRTQGLRDPGSIALDVVGGKMYWVNWGTDKIQRANLDGSNIKDLVTRTQGLAGPWSIALRIPSSYNPTPIAKEDVNRDGVVDVHDLAYVGLQYGKTGTNAADVNGDGVVNVDDFILVAAVIDKAAAAAPAARAKVESQFTKTQLQGWLTEARASGNTSRTYQRGIAVIEHLLRVFTPEKTALLANYPNPFNPETWIPYQLSKPTDVILTIYDIKGSVVRVLDLGHQRAGVYQTRGRAAYWDGRNAVGEKVASGLYFYTLTAGDFSATRKMLIIK